MGIRMVTPIVAPATAGFDPARAPARMARSEAHFERASSLVTPDMIAEAVVCGPDADRHAENVRQFEQAGYDEVYVQQIGPDQEQFFRFWSEEVLPKLR